jgi:hypothetical protein
LGRQTPPAGTDVVDSKFAAHISAPAHGVAFNPSLRVVLSLFNDRWSAVMTITRLANLAIAAATILSAAIGPASATTPLPTLPDAVSYERFGLNSLANVQTSSAVGTLDYTGQPGCGGICEATTQLGSDPSVSAENSEVVFDGMAFGEVQASLGYYVEYLNAPGTYPVDIHAVDTLSSPDGSSMASHLQFGIAGPNTTALNNFSSTAFEEAHCLNGCTQGFTVPTGSPFTPDNVVEMVANTPYFLETDVFFRPQPTGVEISGSVDPMFSTDVLGGEFIFSPGVLGSGALSGGLPEPATWTMLLFGFAGIGFLTQRRKARRAAAGA